MATALVRSPAIDPRHTCFRLAIRESKIHRRGVYALEPIPTSEAQARPIYLRMGRGCITLKKGPPQAAYGKTKETALKSIFATTLTLSAGCFSALRCQQVDIFLGVGTARASSNGGSYDTLGDGNLYSAPPWTESFQISVSASS